MKVRKIFADCVHLNPTTQKQHAYGQIHRLGGSKLYPLKAVTDL